MSMPQHFTVVVISNEYDHGCEMAGAVTSLLKGVRARAIQPYLAAASLHGYCRLSLSNALAARGILFCEPVKPHMINPQSVDLWIALEERGAERARSLIEHYGPAPSGFYRHPFPEVVQPYGSPIPTPPSDDGLDAWLDSLLPTVEAWRKRIWDAFYDSS